MFAFEMFQSINNASVDAPQKLRMITRVFGTPYSELASLAKEIMKAISYPQPIKWEYVTDSTTGLRVLKSEKSPDALDNVCQMSNELFK
jgi:hypothetical protein